jgi:hypothetical protein
MKSNRRGQILRFDVDICFIPTVYRDSIFDVLDLFDISFDVENQPDLDSILADLGVSLTDFDPTVLDTE